MAMSIYDNRQIGKRAILVAFGKETDTRVNRGCIDEITVISSV
ncbi:hypothetical protein [Tuberibacillus sp. Marseille-P3662]|nr:hypothetical protein [Tuberibacillus sp. Marseille-P3662]